jgi:hypothetical protein
VQHLSFPAHEKIQPTAYLPASAGAAHGRRASRRRWGRAPSGSKPSAISSSSVISHPFSSAPVPTSFPTGEIQRGVGHGGRRPWPAMVGDGRHTAAACSSLPPFFLTRPTSSYPRNTRGPERDALMAAPEEDGGGGAEPFASARARPRVSAPSSNGFVMVPFATSPRRGHAVALPSWWLGWLTRRCRFDGQRWLLRWGKPQEAGLPHARPFFFDLRVRVSTLHSKKWFEIDSFGHFFSQTISTT